MSIVESLLELLTIYYLVCNSLMRIGLGLTLSCPATTSKLLTVAKKAVIRVRNNMIHVPSKVVEMY